LTFVARCTCRSTGPAALIARSDKAHFAGILWPGYSRAFIERWDGQGIPHALVDEHALRRVWEEPTPHFGTAMLLQSAWLASDRVREGEEPLDGDVE
jgi:hypothetical protein